MSSPVPDPPARPAAPAPHPPPSGIVAFLFTDIERSTQLWEERPQAMAVALRHHDEAVRAAVAHHGGYVFSTAGDGFGIAFLTVSEAVFAAIEIQRTLTAERGDVDLPLRVRMGVHVGSAEERNGDYYGPVVNRTARLMAAAHGGQILVSALAARLFDLEADATVELRELGSHRLKDLLTPEHIWQVSGSGLPREFPPLRSRRAGNIPSNHPVAIGREREFEELTSALGASRLVTVVSSVGPSAAALCLGVALAVDERFSEGAWHLNVSELDHGAELAPALAAMLGIGVDAGDEASDDEARALATTAAALEDKPALFVLEGGTLGGELARAVARLLEALPSATLLVVHPVPLGLAGERTVEVRARSLPGDLQRIRSGPFLARDDELQRLHLEVARAAHGERRLVMVSGEEGIGKSRLVAELAAEVASEDGLVLRGAWDESGVTDFQAFREAFARHLEQVDRAALRARFGDLLPVLDALVPSAGIERGLGSDADRYRLLDALDSWLATAAAVQPVLLWLDDLQWADPSSLQMLQHLARSPRPATVVIVATFQPAALEFAGDVSRMLTLLRRSPGFEQVELEGLSTLSATALISETGTTLLAPRSLALLHEWSGGNPYFLKELAHLVDESVPPESSGRPHALTGLEELGAPSSLSEVVHWRLARRSPRLAEVLTVAAAIGTTFDAATLVAVLDASPAEVDDLVDEAVAAGFLEEVAGSRTSFSFTKDLVRQALYQELRPRQRDRLHRKVLEVLLAEPEPDPAAVARHLSIAAGPDDLAMTVEYATAAAERATSQMAFENAARHYEEALRVLERYPEVDGPRIELRIAAGEAHNKGGALTRGREHLSRAAREATEQDRPDLMARAAFAWGGLLPTSPPIDTEAVDLLRSVAELFPGDAPERAQALVRQAEWLHGPAPYDQRRALVDEALAIAERLGDPAVLGRVVSSAASAMYGPDLAEESPAIADRVIELGRAADDEGLAFEGWKLRLQGLFALGRMAETREVAATIRRLGERLRQPEYLRIAVMWDATVATMEGRFADARRRGEEALRITLTGDHSQVEEIQLMLRVPMFGLRGAPPNVLDMLERVGPQSVRGMRAWFHAEAGESDRARALLGEPGLVERIAAHRWYIFWSDVVGFGTAAALTGDVEHARRLRDLLTPYRDHSAVLGIAAFLGSAAHHEGVLSGAVGDYDRAVASLGDGLERHEEMGARPWAALSRIELARVLEARGAAGDLELAAGLRAAALEVADELDLASVRLRAGRPLAAPGR